MEVRNGMHPLGIDVRAELPAVVAIVNATPCLPWEPLCLFPLFDAPGSTWTRRSRSTLRARTVHSAQTRSASGKHLSDLGSRNSNQVDHADEEEEEETLLSSILDLVPNGPPPSIRNDQPSAADRACARIFELERRETLGEAAFIGIQTSLAQKVW